SAFRTGVRLPPPPPSFPLCFQSFSGILRPVFNGRTRLNPYRRHLESCPQTSMKARRCGCPIWVHGKVGGKFVRKSLGTRNWEVARHLAREWELGKTESVLLSEACERFLKDCERRKLASVGKYKLLTRELKEWFGERSVGSIAVNELREYCESWKLA